MARTMTGSPETFIVRAVVRFGANVRHGFSIAGNWRRRAVQATERRLDDVSKWLARRKWAFIFVLAALIWAGLMLWFFIELGRGKVKGDGAQVGAGGAIGATLVSGVVSPLLALLTWLAILLVDRLMKLVMPLVLFVPLLAWTPVYALWQAVIVLAKLLLLVPLFVLFVATRLIQLWRGIFFTCPSRRCSYRGLPEFVCSKCGTGNIKLWPNLIGLFWHPCTRCNTRLPTLDILGRSRLEKLCGGDSMPLLGRHAGKAPERLVAIVGGPASGKTNYLLMAVHQMTQDGAAQIIQGEIDDPAQEREFRREWARLETGTAAAKTAETPNAFLLYARVRGVKCQVYLYDAPGEEFVSIGSMTRQQYFPLLEGFMMLVDPLDFDGTPHGAKPFEQIVASTVATARSSTIAPPSRKLPHRVAVVISKADEKIVRDAIGDVALGAVCPEKCREALNGWGARNAIVALEHHFETVEYFACSPLGRAVDPRNREPFSGNGVLEPLAQILMRHEVTRTRRPAATSRVRGGFRGEA